MYLLRTLSRGLGWWMHLGVEVTELSTNKQHHLKKAEKDWSVPLRTLGACEKRVEANS